MEHEQKINPGNGRLRYASVLRRILQRGTPGESDLRLVWESCQGTDAIIFSHTAHAAYHVAEKLRVQCFAAHLFPIVPTRDFPSPFAPKRLRLGPTYNQLTHISAQQIFWLAGRGWVNRWRTETLRLPAHPLAAPFYSMRKHRVPQLFAFSPTVIPKPKDWDEWFHVTGYWFLDDADWQPPRELTEFLAGGEPPVCVGFGSMRDARAEELNDVVLEALSLVSRRAVLVKGWGRFESKLENVFVADSVPFHWLYPRMAAIVHHGGTGTVAEALRSGKPSVTVPFFGEQRFWGAKLAELGVGPRPIERRNLTARRLADAINVALNDPSIRARADAVGERIRREDGVANAVEIINEHCAANRVGALA